MGSKSNHCGFQSISVFWAQWGPPWHPGLKFSSIYTPCGYPNYSNLSNDKSPPKTFVQPSLECAPEECVSMIDSFFLHVESQSLKCEVASLIVFHLAKKREPVTPVTPISPRATFHFNCNVSKVGDSRSHYSIKKPLLSSSTAFQTLGQGNNVWGPETSRHWRLGWRCSGYENLSERMLPSWLNEGAINQIIKGIRWWSAYGGQGQSYRQPMSNNVGKKTPTLFYLGNNCNLSNSATGLWPQLRVTRR